MANRREVRNERATFNGRKCEELEDKAEQRLLRTHDVQHFPEHCSGIFSLVS